MRNFFKTKKWLDSLFTKSVAFCFVALFAVGMAYTVAPTHQTLAADDQNVSRDDLEVIREQNRANGLTADDAKTESGIFTSIFNTLQTIPNIALSLIAQVLIQLSSWILWAGAQLLDKSIEYSIVKIGTYMDDAGGILFIWKIIRDLANMSFIFILLYSAIQMILGMGGSGVKKLITNIFIAALLINFSLFFTQVIIDVSNGISIAFYKQVLQTTCTPEVRVDGLVIPGKKAENISDAFMCKLGLANLWDQKIISKLVDKSTDGADGTLTIAMYGIMGTLLILIAAFIFGAGALMFIVRFLKFIKALIISPIAFASIAIPGIPKEYGIKGWFDDLFKNCMIAPAFMATTWVVLTLLGKMGGQNGSMIDVMLGTNGGPPSEGAVNALLHFVIAVCAMVAILMASEKFGGYAAKGAIGFLKTSQGWAQGQIGRGAVRVSGLGVLDDKFKNSDFGNTRFGAGLRNITTAKVTGAKFGSEDSVSSMNKKLGDQDKKFAEKRTENLKKEVEKKFDQNEKGYKENIALKNIEISNAEKEIKAHQYNSDNAQDLDAFNDHQAKLTESKKKLENLKKEKEGIESNIGEKAKEKAVRDAFNEEADRLNAVEKGDLSKATKMEKILETPVTKYQVGAARTGGVVAGFSAGALAGSAVVPGIGTIVGGVAGGVGAYYWGKKVGSLPRGSLVPSTRKAVVKKLREDSKDVMLNFLKELKSQHDSDKDFEEDKQKEKVYKDYDELGEMKGGKDVKNKWVKEKIEGKEYADSEGFDDKKREKVKESMEKIIEKSMKK